jgi:hypothetical protein
VNERSISSVKASCSVAKAVCGVIPGGSCRCPRRITQTLSLAPNECSPFRAEGYLQRPSNRINSRAGGDRRISRTRSSNPGRAVGRARARYAIRRDLSSVPGQGLPMAGEDSTLINDRSVMNCRSLTSDTSWRNGRITSAPSHRRGISLMRRRVSQRRHGTGPGVPLGVSAHQCVSSSGGPGLATWASPDSE